MAKRARGKDGRFKPKKWWQKFYLLPWVRIKKRRDGYRVEGGFQFGKRFG